MIKMKPPCTEGLRSATARMAHRQEPQMVPKTMLLHILPLDLHFSLSNVLLSLRNPSVLKQTNKGISSFIRKHKHGSSVKAAQALVNSCNPVCTASLSSNNHMVIKTSVA